ncbi:putative protein U [Human mastadenovirus B]|jgi:hypothetical protein|uniref:U n=22 Tax=Human mastadenovirus B TaxID=108098 RepID=A0A6M4W6F9_9ADEN
MKIVGKEEEIKFDIPFKVWRKYATLRRLEYQSWEEGEVLLVESFDKDCIADFK